MIIDGENQFFENTALSATDLTSEVVKTGVGDAGDPLHLVLRVKGGSEGGTAKTVLQTAKDEAFTSPVVLGTYDKVPLSVSVPRGDLGYMRLVVTSTYTAGTVSAALVVDDNINW